MKRKVFYVDVKNEIEGGFYPSIVTEDEAGHAPVRSAFMVWGPTYEDATAKADELNTAFGYTKRDVQQVILSSMRLSEGNKGLDYERMRQLISEWNATARRPNPDAEVHALRQALEHALTAWPEIEEMLD